MGKIGNIVLGLLLVVTAIGYYLLSNKQQNGELAHQKDRVEHFTLKSLDGKKFNIKASEKHFNIQGLEEKIVFLKVFGWNCTFCKKEIPELINLKKDLANSIEVIAIEAQQHSAEESNAFIQEYGINYPIVLGEDQATFYSYLEKNYGWSGVIPLTIVLGKEGKVLAFEVGAKSYTLAELMKASLKRN